MMSSNEFQIDIPKNRFDISSGQYTSVNYNSAVILTSKWLRFTFLTYKLRPKRLYKIDHRSMSRLSLCANPVHSFGRYI